VANWSKSMGPNFVPAYQVSGIPYVTGSVSVSSVGATAESIKFPSVTRFFTVTNTGAKTLRVGFTKHGIDGTSQVRPGVGDQPTTKNWFEVPAGTMSPRLEIRCKELFFRATDGSNPTGFTVLAGLSAVDSSQFPVLTGTLMSGSIDGIEFPLIGVPTFEGVG